jgi:hypothetical protein
MKRDCRHHPIGREDGDRSASPPVFCMGMIVLPLAGGGDQFLHRQQPDQIPWRRHPRVRAAAVHAGLRDSGDTTGPTPSDVFDFKLFKYYIFHC